MTTELIPEFYVTLIKVTACGGSMHSLPLYVYLLDRHLHSRPPELGREDEAVSGDEQERRECHQVADSRILPYAGSIMLRRIEEGRVKS